MNIFKPCPKASFPGSLPWFAAIMFLAATLPAYAGSHLWRFSEFYSSADRKVQFIEMQEIAGSSNETHIQNRWFQTDTYNLDNTILLGSNLVGDTANKKFLIGTVSYAALPGVPAPDYIFPDGFFNPDGDTILWWTYQTIVIPPGVMPTNGIDSITVVDPNIPTYSVATNSPTNFAGVTGRVDLPCPPAGDLNSDGSVNIADLLLLMRQVVGSSPP